MREKLCNGVTSSLQLKFILLLLFLLVCSHRVRANPQLVEFTKHEFIGDLREFHWISDKIAILRTVKELRYTLDEGKTWKSLNHLCENQNECVGKIISNNIDKKMIVLIGQHEKNWFIPDISKEPEAIIKQFSVQDGDVPKKVLHFQFHPTEKNKALALVDHKSGEHLGHYDLFTTTDIQDTQSWKLMLSDTLSASFGNLKGEKYDGTKIFGIRHSPVMHFSGRSTFFTVDMSNPKAISDQLIHGAELFVLNKYFFVGTVDKDELVGLQVSSDNGNTFLPVKFPLGLKEHSYTLLDASEGAVFINVYHNQRLGEPWGNIYLSDSTGSRYSFSLFFNRRIGQSCDFHKIKSMEGVYIANVVRNMLDGDCANCKGFEQCNKMCHFGTKITYDKGGKWHSLEAPLIDSQKKEVVCPSKLPSGKCPLHLHGLASQEKTPILSHRSAVGLIMASGNVGPYLHTGEGGDVNTYLSRDAGVTWEEIYKGPSTYEFADHGGLMVLGPLHIKTGKIKYSWNEGLEWNEAEFAKNEEQIRLTKFRVTPHNPVTKRLIIEGEKNFNTMIYLADFSPLHERDCKGIENPGAADSDYELFLPHSYASQCLLGRKVQYTRRKREAKCFNPDNLSEEKPKTISHCECTLEDFECDFGYQPKTTEDGKTRCELLPGENEQALKAPPSPCYTYYNETKGYRRVAGDTCVGGVSLDPNKKQCPSHMGIIGSVVLLLFSAVVVSFGVFLIYNNSPFLQTLFSTGIPSSYMGDPSYKQIVQVEDFGLGEEEEEEPDEIDSAFSPPVSSTVLDQRKSVLTITSSSTSGSTKGRRAFPSTNTDEDDATPSHNTYPVSEQEVTLTAKFSSVDDKAEEFNPRKKDL